MSYKPTLFIDMDGVLNHFGGYFHTYALNKYPYVGSKSNFRTYSLCDWFLDLSEDMKKQILLKPEFWRGIPANLEVIADLESNYSVLTSCYKVCILTTPYYDAPWCAYEKRQWIKRNLPFFPVENIIFAENKSLLANAESILIDDFLDNCKDFSKAGGHAFYYPRAYNEELAPFNQIKPFTDFLYFLKENPEEIA